MNSDNHEQQTALTDSHSRREVLAAILAGAGGVLLAGTVGTWRALAHDEDDDDSGDDSSGHGGGDDHSGSGGGGDDDEPVINGEIPAGSLEVRIEDDDADGFVPGDLTVDLGQSVTFVNAHDDPHTATGSGFDTGIIPPGGTATVILDTPGSFAYACLIHPIMTGRIAVRDANGQVPAAPQSAADVPADATAVQVVDFGFDPPSVSVPAGATVVWTNAGAVPHTVTASDGSFDSGIFDPGSTFAWTFESVANVAYVCALHPQMQGSVEVTGAASASADSAAANPDVVATPDLPSVEGTWTVTLTPESRTNLQPITAVLTVRDDGTLQGSVAQAADALGELALSIGAIHGSWSAGGDGRLRLLWVAFLVDGDERFGGTLTVLDELTLDASGNAYQGNYQLSVEGPSDELLASHAGTSSGERLDVLAAAPVTEATVPAADASASDATVTIRDFDFDPPELTIAAGTTITWINDGVVPHTATADDASFDTGQIPAGDEGSQTFEQPGTYGYFCAIHPNMQGTIIVK